MFKKSLHLRILFFTVALLAAFGIISVFLERMALGVLELIIFWILAVSIGGAVLSLVIRRSFTGPLRKNARVIRRIAAGGGEISERLEGGREDELGDFVAAINGMLDALEKRAQENERLLELVAGSRHEWVATFDAIQDLILIHDRDCRVIKVNKALALKRGSQPEDLIGKKCHEIFNRPWEPCDWCAASAGAQAENDRMIFEGVYRITTFPAVRASGDVWASVHVARDVTREKTLMEQLVQAEKLSSIGMLVAGIAHELNNPLMGIMGFSQLLLDAPGERNLRETRGKLEKIYNEALRAAKIVQNLLTFARQNKVERRYMSINEVLQRTLDLRAYSLQMNNIDVSLDLDEYLPKTMVDPFQMQQVFINIMNNAEDAMAANGRGTLTIRTCRSGGNIEITFIDDGPGIQEEIIGKVFDPFFTTKGVGKGTGLGLSITHGIITEHGGKIGVKNEPGGGAAVSILIPVSGGEGIEERREAPRESRRHASGKKVLIVDDEESIRETVEDVLAAEGFRVETVDDGAAALLALEKERFDLVITDVRMPGLDGAELYEKILRRCDYLKDRVIILTGDVFSPRTRVLVEKYGCNYLLKPFEMKELTRLVRKVLS